MAGDYDDSNDPGELAIYAYRKQFGQEDGEPEIDPHLDLEDEQARAIRARLESEIEKASGTRISQDAPGYDLLVKSRNNHITATRKLHNIAVGEAVEADDGYIAPDRDEGAPAYSAVKPATGFQVASNRRKTVIPAPAPVNNADPSPAATHKPAQWLWGSK